MYFFAYYCHILSRAFGGQFLDPKEIEDPFGGDINDIFTKKITENTAKQVLRCSESLEKKDGSS